MGPNEIHGETTQSSTSARDIVIIDSVFANTNIHRLENEAHDTLTRIIFGEINTRIILKNIRLVFYPHQFYVFCRILKLLFIFAADVFCIYQLHTE